MLFYNLFYCIVLYIHVHVLRCVVFGVVLRCVALRCVALRCVALRNETIFSGFTGHQTCLGVIFSVNNMT